MRTNYVSNLKPETMNFNFFSMKIYDSKMRLYNHEIFVLPEFPDAHVCIVQHMWCPTCMVVLSN
jgi:hypothetical protein